MKIFKNIFTSSLFLLRHAVLFCILNSVLYFLLNVFLFNLLSNNFSIILDRITPIHYITADKIFYYLVMVLKTIIIFTFYSLSMNNENEGISSDLFLYISDFLKVIFYVITTGLTFFILLIFSFVGLITGILFFDFCVYSMVLSAIRSDDSGEKYSATQNIAQSFKLTKKFRMEIFIFNNILFFCFAFLVYIIPSEIFVGGFNISYLINLLIYNLLIVYLIKDFFTLESSKNDEWNKIQQEEENKKNEMRKVGTV